MTVCAARHVGGFARCGPSRCSLRSNKGHSIPGGTVMAIQQTAMKNSDTEVADVETFETIVIGGGQAGLSVGYYLKRRGGSFVILDANERIGGSWRTGTWNSLRLFTPARYDGLPGWSYPTARETADYLEAYAARFGLPVRAGMNVDRVTKDGGRFVVECGKRR